MAASHEDSSARKWPTRRSRGGRQRHGRTGINGPSRQTGFSSGGTRSNEMIGRLSFAGKPCNLLLMGEFAGRQPSDGCSMRCWCRPSIMGSRRRPRSRRAMSPPQVRRSKLGRPRGVLAFGPLARRRHRIVHDLFSDSGLTFDAQRAHAAAGG